MSELPSHPVSIQVAGAKPQLGINGVYFLMDTNKTGTDRIWRNKSGGRIYYANGWTIADVYSASGSDEIFYQEAGTKLSDDSPLTYQEDPWMVSETNWVPARPNYAATIFLTKCEDTAVTRQTSENNEPLYEETKDETIKATRSYYTKTFYRYFKTNVDNEILKGLVEGKSYYEVKKISAGAKVDLNTFYRLNNFGEPFLISPETEDTYFEQDKVYFTCPSEGVYVQALFIESNIPSYQLYCRVGNRSTRIIKVIDTRESTTEPIVRVEKVEIVDNKQEVELDVRTRYVAPELEVGHIYRFSFVKDFKYLGYMPPSQEDYQYTEEEQTYNDSDITRGIFKVDNITNYADIILSGIDVYQNLYLPLSIPQDVYEKDRKTWMNSDTWYKLVDPVLAPRIFYVPAAIINGIPDANVTGFDRLQLIVDIGVFNNPDLLTDLVTTINMLMKARYGITGAAELASYDKVYIPNMYYRWLEEQRIKNKDEFMKKHKEQYFNTVCAEEYNQWVAENKSLRQLVKAYEDNLTGATGNA